MLHLHRAERSDRLVEALGDLLGVPLDDPFTAEVVAVPAKGVERWLSQQLATLLGHTEEAGLGQGVSANIRFPSPDRLVAEAIQAVEGRTVDDDPWTANRVLWTTLRVIDESVQAVVQCPGHPPGHRPRRSSGRTTLGDGGHAGRSVHRLRRRAPADAPRLGRPPGHRRQGRALPDHLQWQAELWRRLRATIDTESAAERLDDVCARLRADPGLVGLPPRISIFGPTRLSTEQLSVIDALAADRDVHLWLPHPSPAMWTWLSAAAPAANRQDDVTGFAVTNPLLASLARDQRELQQRLRSGTAQRADTHHPAGPDAGFGSLLTEIQRAVRDDRAPTRTATRDDTVQVHACHGPARQVEVLREALLHAFAADPTLEPRDVLVMCPDVETYAPLIRACFGQGAAAGAQGHPGHRLRVRLADRSLTRTNPLLDTVTTLLDLAGDRVTASQVLDLAATPGVRRRFEFDDDDLEQLRTWAARSGVRWGINIQQRRAYGLAEIQAGHLADRSGPGAAGRGRGRDRPDLVGAGAAAGRRRQHRCAPGGPTERTGGPPVVGARLASGATAGTAVGGPAEPGAELLTDVRERDAWQLAQAQRELAEAVEFAGTAPLRLADVRAMLSERLAGRPTRANFRTGELTVATLVPMRSVPHRVVALLGLDDDVFPRGPGWTATTFWPWTRGSANGIGAARTGSCCWTQ